MNNKYEEVIKKIELLIEDGDLKPGDKLPSIRTLSGEFQWSINTVIKAYSELEKAHKVYSIPKSGYYLVGGRQSQLTTEKEVIDFTSAGPDKWNMPYRDYQHCMNQAIELYKEDMFQYSEPLGLSTLRFQLMKHLQELQVFATKNRIAVVSGSQQALDILVSLPFPNKKEEICIEQPTHFSMIDSILTRGLNPIGIEVGKEGIDLNLLEKFFKERPIKFFYTVSRFHNPTGFSYSNKDKKKIVNLAKKYDVYIIEDDYMGDLDTRKKADPMFAYDPSGRVIYTKSFSKVLLPGLRLGVVVLPEFLTESFTRAKFAADVHTPVITQGALEIYLKSGMYEAHIQRLRKIYKKKGNILNQAFLAHLPVGTSFTGAESGFYSTIHLPNNIKGVNLANALKRKNVLVQEASGMYLPQYKKENVIRLSVSQVEDNMIQEGIQRIGKEIKELLFDWRKG